MVLLRGRGWIAAGILRLSGTVLAVSVCLSTRLVADRVDKRGLRKTAALSDPVLSLFSLM